MQDALEVRIAHADLVHVLERIADVVDAGPAAADALRHEPRPAVQIELPHIRGVPRIGDEGKRAHFLPVREANRNEPRLVHPARHLSIPKPRQGPAQARRVDAIGHAPARAAAAKTHHKARLAARAAVARREDAKRAVIAVRAAERLLAVFEAGRPHERAVAEYPEVSLGQQRPELAEVHSARNI